MPSTAALATYILASILIIIVPGPTVTVIIGNSLKHGVRAGLLNVAGTQIGLVGMIVILAFGYSAAVASMGGAFEILRLIGAAYLAWLGTRLWRSGGSSADMQAAGVTASRSFVLQGFIVIWSNPKALLFFGAFIPQFVDPAGDAASQIIVLGGIFMLVGAVFDALYAIAAGAVRGWLSAARIRIAERIAGSFLIAGGLWLALARR